MRTRLADALADYAHVYGRSGLVTGFVVVYELTEPNGTSTCWWMSGNGAEPNEKDEAGLAVHRVLGMLVYVTRVIQRRIKA